MLLCLLMGGGNDRYGVGYVGEEFFWLVDIILGPGYHARYWWII